MEMEKVILEEVVMAQQKRTCTEAQAQYKEIIADELNHIERFGQIFIDESGIEPSKD